ncbi:hypothetical protein VC279_16615 [Xanthomonas sp. WHRI 10064A]|uniref:hypothetical protein n=1 Tax=unclassified Xanthomonas TaxID=2643310 RepID=UPI002B223522|nr:MULTISPECIES: hypothetical protein [unclassified Xanthomonas]MEA9587073.1 hypothetical protein [Xanthomonas sp. WHRI 10064B]MEA9616264.1 hypothetical protein [Xanthomonas sp. WHRI 10064A]
MKVLRCSPGLLAFFALWHPVPVRAAASMVVDDAGVTPRGQCQLEAWWRATPGGASATAVPACNVLGTELALGLSDSRHGPVLLDLGAKRVLRDPERHAWGLALSVGTQRTWRDPQQRNYYATLPMTWSLGADASTRIHFNIGAVATHAEPDTTNVGIGLEHDITSSWTLLAEAFGDDHNGEGSQLGLRRMVGRASSIDLVAGRDRLNAPRGWITLGINLALLP